MSKILVSTTRTVMSVALVAGEVAAVFEDDSSIPRTTILAVGGVDWTCKYAFLMKGASLD